MASQRPHDYEQRVRSLRKRLALDFQPLRDTLSRGLDVLIDSEAAVLCTATVEALCDALFHVVVKNLHENAAANLAPLDTKVTVYDLHVALRSHDDFAQLLARVESASAVVACFLDDFSSRALYARHLLTTPEAKHLRPSPLASSASAGTLPTLNGNGDAEQEDEEVALHARIRSEWQKREDDPFQDVDFAMVLKCVHPAFTLTHSATLLLSALVRELLNAVCDECDLDSVQRRVPPELFVEDLEAPLTRVFHVGGLALAIERTSRECLERFRLRSRQGATLTLRCRVFASSAAAKAKASAATFALPPVSRDVGMGKVLIQMCKTCRADAAVHIGVYRGRKVDAASTPRALGMPTGAVVYLVRAQWWDYVRRNDARRGLLVGTRMPTAPRYRGGGEGSPRGDESSPHKPFTLPTQRTKLCGGGKSTDAHAASASRLKGVGRDRGRCRGDSGRSDGEDSCTSGEDGDEGQGQEEEEEDSLSRLLRQRRREEGNDHPRHFHARTSSPPFNTPHSTTMAMQSTQIMDTLDEAWLGFAQLSKSLRSFNESLQQQREEAGHGKWRGNGSIPLANEQRMCLEKIGELVRQTSSARELVTQLQHCTKRLQIRYCRSEEELG